MNWILRKFIRFLKLVGTFVFYLSTRFCGNLWYYEGYYGAVGIKGVIRAKSPDDALYTIKTNFIKGGMSEKQAEGLRFIIITEYGLTKRFKSL